jgi:hypothetical protein
LFQNGIARTPEHDLPWSAFSGKSVCKIILENLMKPAVFRGQTIPFCHKPELLESFKFTCWGLKNAGNLLLLDKAIS